MVKVTISQILKKTNETISTREATSKSMEDAIKLIAKIDKAMLKEHIKFKYTLEELD